MSTKQSAADAAGDLTTLVLQTSLEGLSPQTVESARLCLLDTLGCAIAGRDAEGVAVIRALVTEAGGRPQANVWGTDARVPADAAAFANAMSGHALDFDDQHPGVLHTSVCVVPAAIAACEARGVTDIGRLLTAVVVATEVADRLAVATTVGPGVSGWLLTPLCGYFGAAAAVAVVAGLGESATRNALGFAYVQTSGNGQSTLDGALAKRMQPAFAARGGTFAVALAERGLTAPWNSVEGKRGYFHVYHKDHYDPSVLRRGTDRQWLIDLATFKPYPCCAWTHAALECGLALHGAVDPERIASVRIGVNAQAYQSTGTPLPRRFRPQNEVDAQFSIPYMFALAAISGAVTLGDFSAAALARPEIVALAEKVEVVVRDDFDARYGRQISPARAEVALDDGTTISRTVLSPLGMGERRLGRPELLRKFGICCAHAGLARKDVDEIAKLVLDETGDCLPRLWELLGVSA